MRTIIKRVLAGFGTLALLGLGLWLNGTSFDRVHEMRQLERVPHTAISGVIPGEVNLTGRVEAGTRLVRAPRTGTEAVLYRYVIEEERTDSDGNTYWTTVRDETRFAEDFWLQDETGRLQVTPSEAVDFRLSSDYRVTEGSRRYTEYRVEPGDEIFLFGYAQPADEHYVVGFRQAGSYQPILSDGTALDARVQMAGQSAFYLLGGLAAFAGAVLLLLWLLRIHHSAAYLVGLSMVMITALLAQGVLMMQSDLEDTVGRGERALQAGSEAIQQTLATHEVAWDGDWGTLGALSHDRYATVPSETRAQIDDMRLGLARAVQRSNTALSRFPENLLAAGMGIEAFEPISLPDKQQAVLSQLEADFAPTRLPRSYALLALLGAGLIGYWTSRKGFATVRVKRLIENLPTSPIDGVVYGLTEVEGTAAVREADDVLTAPLSGKPCVYYSYQEKKKDSSDDWKVVRREEKCVPFLCRDDSGSIAVDPVDYESHRTNGAARAVDATNAEFIAATSESRKRGERRYWEQRIEPGESLYVLGSATIDEETHDRLRITTDDGELPYIISSLPGRQVMIGKAFTAFAFLAVGVVATVGVGLATAGTFASFGPALYGTTTLFSLAYLLVGLGLLYYNDLVFLRHRVDRNWANIDVALKKRFDLISRLADTVSGYLDHEREVQAMVSEARAAHGAKGEVAPDDDALAVEDDVRDTVVAVVESYPELKGQRLVHELMDALTEVEKDVALMREGYNDIAERYNTRCQQVPEIFIARPLGFSTVAPYAAPDAQQPVRLDPSSRQRE